MLWWTPEMPAPLEAFGLVDDEHHETWAEGPITVLTETRPSAQVMALATTISADPRHPLRRIDLLPAIQYRPRASGH